MGKPRDLFKKIRDIKGTLLAKMGSMKDINIMDRTEAEDIKKRWQEYTEVYSKVYKKYEVYKKLYSKLYKKDLNDQDNHDGVIIHLEPDILECV